jgi:hypothetical protein
MVRRRRLALRRREAVDRAVRDGRETAPQLAADEERGLSRRAAVREGDMVGAAKFRFISCLRSGLVE